MATIPMTPLSKEQVQKIIDDRLAAIIEKEISNEKYNKLTTNKNEKAD